MRNYVRIHSNFEQKARPLASEMMSTLAGNRSDTNARITEETLDAGLRGLKNVNAVFINVPFQLREGRVYVPKKSSMLSRKCARVTSVQANDMAPHSTQPAYVRMG